MEPAMQSVLDQALKELRDLPQDAQDAIAHDLLEMIRSEAKWDELFADPRSDAAFEKLLVQTNAEEQFDFDPATRSKKVAE
jgi:hypothetical protein